MATSLLEKYQQRLSVADKVYAKEHNGARLDNHKKLVVASCLHNISKFLGESFDAASGTQRADLGAYKKFCLNLTNIAIPNLIAHDLVLVHPMTSMTGYVAYLEYQAGKTKGGVENGDMFNSPFRMGMMDENRSNYTSDRVVESFTTTSTTEKEFTLVWEAAILENGKLSGGKVIVDGTETEDYTASTAEGKTKVTLNTAPGNNKLVRIAYLYDNIVVPQNDIPTIKAVMKNIPLLAKARRIAVYYSQIAAFQAKTDYGFDLGDQLAEQAVGELSYEIDSEIVNLLTTLAGDVREELTWSKAQPVGVSKRDHYAGFSEIPQLAAKRIYDVTQKFAPNYMIASSALLPVLTLCDGFTAAPAGQMNGPYYAGTFDQLKVFVSPMMEEGVFVIGVNGNDMMSSAAVYAPYMAIVPTQLLQYADGGTSQGFSTMYDLKPLNEALVVKGKIVA